MEQESFNELLKSKLIEVFDYTIQFLNSRGLRWYVCAGTAIGAVRHKDIIPWDDDIDILMPRSDYDKLLECSNEMDGSGYKLFSLKDNGYYHPYYKIIDMNTTIWENRLIPYVLGAYVDIFPLEDTNITPTEYEALHNKCMKDLHKFHRSLTIPRFNVFVDLFIHKRLKTFLNVVNNALFYRWFRKYFLNKFVKDENKFYSPNGLNYAQPYGYCGAENEIYKKEWFADVIKGPFNRLTANIPVGYDQYLTQLFGDYMTPPPEDKRRCHDGRYYINLKERLTIPEIEKRVKKGITREV